MNDNVLNPAGTQVHTVSTGMLKASHGNPSAYLDYSPIAPPHEGKGVCYRTCLDRLGMKQDALNIRVQFVQEVKEHTQEPECLFLRKEDNAAAFDELMSGFLRKRGSYYWGVENRDHLAEQDTSKGFLYPRDAERPNSRLMEVLEELFNYKAFTARRNDLVRPLERQHIPSIDFASLVPSEINTTRHTRSSLAATQTSIKDTRLQEERSGTEDQYDSDMPLTRRRRLLLNSMTDTDLTTPDTAIIASAPQAPSNASSTVDRKPLYAAQGPSTKPAAGSIPKVNLGVLARKGVSRTPRPSSSSKASIGTQGRPSCVEITAELPARELRNRRKKPRPVPKESKSTQSKARVTRNSMQSPVAPAECIHKEENMNKEEDTCMIIDEATFNNSPSVFMRSQAPKNLTSTIIKLDAEDTDSRQTKIKVEALPGSIATGTTLMVTASCQQDMAPITVKLSGCKPLENLFDFLAEECGLGPRSKKVVAISVTYGWNKRQHRIRGYRFETDLATFTTALRDGWDSDPGVAKRGCEIAMLLHVED